MRHQRIVRWRLDNARNRIVRDYVFAIKRSCWHSATHTCYQVTDDGAAAQANVCWQPINFNNARRLQRPNHVFSGLQQAVGCGTRALRGCGQPFNLSRSSHLVIVGGPNKKWPIQKFLFGMWIQMQLHRIKAFIIQTTMSTNWNNSTACQSNADPSPTNTIHRHSFCSCDLDLDPMTLIYKLDLYPLKM